MKVQLMSKTRDHGERSFLSRILIGVLVLGVSGLIADGLGVGRGPTHAHAQEPTLMEIFTDLGYTNIVEITDETFPAGSYEIHLLAEFADNHASNTVSHYEVGTSDFMILIQGPAGNFGLTNPQISLLLVADTAFGLSFETGSNRFFTETARNPEDPPVKHARIFMDLADPGTFLIGFEDLFGGGDLDFQDMVFRLNPSEGPVAPLTSLSPLEVIPRIYIDEKDTPGLANADREVVISTVISNPGSTDKTLVLCPMLHVHDAEPPEPPETGQLLTITADGGQRVSGTYIHARTMRFPFPGPTPLTVNGNSEVMVNYPAKLSQFIPTLENFTRAEVRDKILNHAAKMSSTLYVDYFFPTPSGKFMDAGETFQCPNGPNTWWKFGIDDPDDFDEAFHWIDFTFTNAFSTVTVPLTIHTSETAGAVLDGTPLSAFIEVTPNCSLVECPPTPGTGGITGRPTVVWSTNPAPGEEFVISEIEQVGSMTIETPEDLPEGATMLFQVTMREAGTGRHLADETKRFAQDTTPPVITSFDFMEDDMLNLEASAMVQDQAASIEFAELLVSRDSGGSFAGVRMDWEEGDYLNPTLFQTTFGPLEAGETLFKIRVADEAGNSSETPTHLVEVTVPDAITRLQADTEAAMIPGPSGDGLLAALEKALNFVMAFEEELAAGGTKQLEKNLRKTQEQVEKYINFLTKEKTEVAADVADSLLASAEAIIAQLETLIAAL